LKQEQRLGKMTYVREGAVFVSKWQNGHEIQRLLT